MLTAERLKSVYRFLYAGGEVYSKKDFAQKMCANPSALSSAFSGRENYLTESLCKRVVDAFPQISLDWLLNGNGSMVVGGSPISKHDVAISGNNITNSPNSCNVAGGDLIFPSQRETALHEVEILPMVPANIAIKQDLDVWKYMSETKVETCRYPSFPMFPDVKLYYTVRLDAMSPRFEPGDVLALVPFPEHGTIIAGNPYIVDTYSMGFVFRLVYNRGDSLECKATNTESIYEDFLIEKTDVIRLYRVLGLVRLA